VHKLPKVGTLLYIRKEDYSTMLEIFDDGEDLPPTWEEWMEGLEDIEQQARAAGALTRRYLITPQSFTEYCRRQSIPPEPMPA
jgi:hypothetical protein